MKRYFKTLSIISAVVMLFASCQKLAPSKAQVEAGFTAPTAVPTLSIGNVECDAINGIVNVNVTVSGLPANKDGLSVGILSSLSPDFLDSKFVEAADLSDGNVVMKGAVTANSTYYVKAIASSPTGGSSSSSVVTVEVPDIPLYYKAPGVYVGTVDSEAYGDSYTSTIYIVADEDDPEHIMWIGGIEPYWADNGYTGQNFDLNYVMATVDEEKGCLVVALGEDAHLGGRVIAGLNAASMDDATSYAPVTFKMTATGDFFRAEAFQTVMSDGSAEDSYAGNTTYKRK